MAVFESMDVVLRLKFEAAIQDHVAKKATSKRIKTEARKTAETLREQAKSLENARVNRAVADR